MSENLEDNHEIVMFPIPLDKKLRRSHLHSIALSSALPITSKSNVKKCTKHFPKEAITNAHNSVTFQPGAIPQTANLILNNSAGTLKLINDTEPVVKDSNGELSDGFEDGERSMTILCSVPTCSSHTLQMMTRTLHRLPKNLKRAQEWAEICGYPQWLDDGLKRARKCIRLCSLHFSPHSFRGTRRRRLRNGSVPMVLDLSSTNSEQNDSPKCVINGMRKLFTTTNVDKPLSSPTSDTEIVKWDNIIPTLTSPPPPLLNLTPLPEQPWQVELIQLTGLSNNSPISSVLHECLSKPWHPTKRLPMEIQKKRGQPVKYPKNGISIEPSQVQLSVPASTSNSNNEMPNISLKRLMTTSIKPIINKSKISKKVQKDATQNAEIGFKEAQEEDFCPAFKKIKLDPHGKVEISKKRQCDEKYLKVKVKSEEIENKITIKNEVKTENIVVQEGGCNAGITKEMQGDMADFDVKEKLEVIENKITIKKEGEEVVVQQGNCNVRFTDKMQGDKADLNVKPKLEVIENKITIKKEKVKDENVVIEQGDWNSRIKNEMEGVPTDLIVKEKLEVIENKISFKKEEDDKAEKEIFKTEIEGNGDESSNSFKVIENKSIKESENVTVKEFDEEGEFYFTLISNIKRLKDEQKNDLLITIRDKLSEFVTNSQP